MDVMDWKTPGVVITDFALVNTDDQKHFRCISAGKYNERDVLIKLPRVLDHVPHDRWVDTLKHEARDYSLVCKLLTLALGESVAQRVMADPDFYHKHLDRKI